MLKDFRSWAALEARFQAPVLVVTGPNGVGKTNLLEAISLLAPGRGMRGAKIGDLGRRVGEDALPWAVSGRLATPTGEVDIGTGTPPDGPLDKRTFRLDGMPVKAQTELAAHIAVVWLTPQMDRLFQEGASERRRFLDRLVWALEPSHARAVAAYENATAQRNRLLAERRGDAGWLAALEDAMASHGVAAVAARRALVQRLNAVLAGGVVGAFPIARLDLACPIAAALEEMPALEVEERLRADLAANRARDAAAGSAAVGAHKTDLRMTHAEKNVPAELCSTGEQKALLVSVVLGHAALIGAARGFAPLLLLDEVAAHLDEGRRTALFEALAALPAQSVLTGTDAAMFEPLAGVAERFTASPEGLSSLS